MTVTRLQRAILLVLGCAPLALGAEAPARAPAIPRNGATLRIGLGLKDTKNTPWDGTIELALSGAASIALDVECIEVQMADIGGAWQAASKPRHP